MLRDAVDDAIEATGKGAKRAGGKLPPHVMTYFAMALALFADDDYEEVAVRLTETLRDWGCWDDSWSMPTSGGITQARQRLGCEPVQELFTQVAVPVADEETAGAFLGPWRLMTMDGFEWDIPDSEENAAEFGYPGPVRGGGKVALKARVVTMASALARGSGCGDRPVTSKGSGEQSLARARCPRLERGLALIADRNFYNWEDWCTAADTGAALLWRVKADLRLPVLELLPDGSYRSVLIDPKIGGKARQKLIEAARAGEVLDKDKARHMRVVEYEVPEAGDGKGELIALITTITDLRAGRRRGARAGLSRKVGTRDRQQAAEDLPARTGQGAAVGKPGHGPAGDLRLPADPLRDQRPDLQGRHRRRMTRTGSSSSAPSASSAAGSPTRLFPPEHAQRILARIMADITSENNLNTRRERSYPRVVKRARHNSYRVKKPGDNGARHDGPPTIQLANPVLTKA